MRNEIRLFVSHETQYHKTWYPHIYKKMEVEHFSAYLVSSVWPIFFYWLLNPCDVVVLSADF